MAIYETQYIADDMTRDFLDVDLAFQSHPVNRDLIKKRNVNAIKASIRNLVLMNHYEKPFHPDIGCDIYKTLFENISLPGTENMMREYIEHTITEYEPRAELQKIDINVDPDYNSVGIKIYFTPLNETVPVSVDILLKILR